MKRPRVLVTGLGAVSALSLHLDGHFDRLLNGESGIEALDSEEYRNYPPLLQAKVTGFDRREMIPHRMLRKLLSPSAAYATAAAGQALRDAGIDQDERRLGNCGLYVGSVCLDTNPEAFIPALKESIDGSNQVDLSRFATHGMKLVDPLFLVKSLPNAGLCAIAIQYQVLGSNLNLTNGPVAGLQSVAAAMAAIERGETQLALAGGYDTLLQMDNIVEHMLEGRLAGSKDGPPCACRPFDIRRDGYALGEGAAFLLLESEEHALGRSARIYGEVISSSQTALGRHPDRLAAADGQPLAVTARQALERGGFDAFGIDVIFGDGLGTRTDDLNEAATFRRVAGDAPVAFTAATGSIGFTGAASGAFSLVHAFLGMHRAVIPPMINCAVPDPACALPFVHHAEPRAFRRALVWNSDRGRKNVAVLAGFYSR